MKLLLAGTLSLSLACGQHFALDSFTGCLLGGSRDGKWIDSKTAGPMVVAGTSFSTVESKVLYKNREAAKPIEGPCGDAWEVDLEGGDVMISGTPGLQPRMPEVLSPTNRTYVAAFRSLLDSRGIRSPVRIESLQRVDLDGDGKAEVIASLYHAAGQGTRAQPGDYSMVAVRQVDARGVLRVNVVEIEKYARGSEDVVHLSLGPLVDINGDGKLELIVRGKAANVKFTHVFELQGSKFVRVLECTCGG